VGSHKTAFPSFPCSDKARWSRLAGRKQGRIDASPSFSPFLMAVGQMWWAELEQVS
jgi:hypothetical protein